MSKKLHIKVGDTVKVISGVEKGKEGKVLKIDYSSNRALVEGLNLVTKHVKPSANNPQGGLDEAEAGIHLSNLMLSVDGVASRVGRKEEDGKLVRILKKNGEVVK